MRAYRVKPREIHFLRFILEACDGLAVQTTLDARAGLVAIACPPDRVQELDGILADLSREMDITPADKDKNP
ncbi:MAG: DUF4911 domain-containing protein [Pseudomonadota bacterium]